ncbi:hypothetical protein M0805_005691 [Coniferiporia weirii]|nr:hypothetical protein M0805_005691 [Coniferiporia weirii]
MSSKTGDAKPLPLSDTLHDLAVLRASDINLTACLAPEAAARPDSSPSTNMPDEQTQLVQRSFDYVRDARAAMAILQRGEVDAQGARVNQVRGGLEDILSGLDAGPDTA